MEAQNTTQTPSLQALHALILDGDLTKAERMCDQLARLQCQGCDVPKGGLHQIAEPARIKPSMSMHVSVEDYQRALAEWKAKPKNGYFDGDDDDEDGTALLKTAEEVIRRSAEVRELRVGDVVCVVKLVDGQDESEQHARLTAIDDPDAETTLAWEFISGNEAKAYYEDKQAQKSTALHPKRVENVISRMKKEGDSQAAETVKAQRARIAELEAKLTAPLVGQQEVQEHEPAAWVATFTLAGRVALHSVVGSNLEELKRSVPSDSVFQPLYTHPTQQGLDGLKFFSWGGEVNGAHFRMFDDWLPDDDCYDHGTLVKLYALPVSEEEAQTARDALAAAQAKQGGV